MVDGDGVAGSVTKIEARVVLLTGLLALASSERYTIIQSIAKF